MTGRTDLAVELREEMTKTQEIKGVSLFTKTSKEQNIKETKIVIESEEGAKTMGKPVGNYITIESRELAQGDESYHEPMSHALTRHLRKLIGRSRNILVAGLGNEQVTPDALGPMVIQNLHITRHIKMEGLGTPDMVLSGIIPGVMAQTGMETQEILKGIIQVTKPQILLVIDALAARSQGRLNKTIQISDTGITPGSGVGNHRLAINQETMGIPVVAIGVPTVIAVPTIVEEAMQTMADALGKTGAREVIEKFSEEERYQLASEMVDPDLSQMFVTPKNIDEAIRRISFTISEAINQISVNIM